MTVLLTEVNSKYRAKPRILVKLTNCYNGNIWFYWMITYCEQ
jgi:hypothetical protein